MGEKIKMAYFIAKFGKSDIKQKVVGGQYKYPKGIFYGGTKVANSHRLLTEFLKKTMPENVEKLAILDVHTGIGPMGIDTLLCNGPKEYTQLSDVTNHYDHIQVRDPEKAYLTKYKETPLILTKRAGCAKHISCCARIWHISRNRCGDQNPRRILCLFLTSHSRILLHCLKNFRSRMQTT